MTRKHYTALASDIAFLVRITTEEVALNAIKEMVKVLTTNLKAENSAFDKERFITACGL